MFGVAEEEQEFLRVYDISPEGNLQFRSIVYPLYKDTLIKKFAFPKSSNGPLDDIVAILYTSGDLVFYDVKENPAMAIHVIPSVSDISTHNYLTNRHITEHPDLLNGRVESVKIVIQFAAISVISMCGDFILLDNGNIFFKSNKKFSLVQGANEKISKICNYDETTRQLVGSNEDGVLFKFNMECREGKYFLTKTGKISKPYNFILFYKSLMVLLCGSEMCLYDLPTFRRITTISHGFEADELYSSRNYIFALKHTHQIKTFPTCLIKNWKENFPFTFQIYTDTFEPKQKPNYHKAFNSDIPIWSCFSQDVNNLSNLPEDFRKLFERVLRAEPFKIEDKVADPLEEEFKVYKRSAAFEPVKIFYHQALNGLSWKEFMQMNPLMDYNVLVKLFNELHFFQQHLRESESELQKAADLELSWIDKLEEKNESDIAVDAMNSEQTVKGSEKALISVTKENKKVEERYKDLKKKVKTLSKITPNSASFARKNGKELVLEEMTKRLQMLRQKYMLQFTYTQIPDGKFVRRRPILDLNMDNNNKIIPGEIQVTSLGESSTCKNIHIEKVIAEKWFPVIKKRNSDITAKDVMTVLMRRPPTAIEVTPVMTFPESYISDVPEDRPREIKTALELYNALPDELGEWAGELECECTNLGFEFIDKSRKIIDEDYGISKVDLNQESDHLIVETKESDRTMVETKESDRNMAETKESDRTMAETVDINRTNKEIKVLLMEQKQNKIVKNKRAKVKQEGQGGEVKATSKPMIKPVKMPKFKPVILQSTPVKEKRVIIEAAQDAFAKTKFVFQGGKIFPIRDK